MIVYKVERGSDPADTDSYFYYRVDCIAYAKETGKKAYKLVLGEGWTPKELVIAILNGNGYVAEEVELKC